MHRIIGPVKGKDGGLGGKAAGLLKLDAAGLTPDFVVLTSGVFAAALASDPLLSRFLRKASLGPADRSFVRKRILSWKLDPGVSRGLRKALSSLKMGRALARSSFTLEGSARQSCAGLFPSLPCRGAAGVELAVKRIWAASFSEEFFAYRRGGRGFRPDMAVVLQRYEKPEFGGLVHAAPGPAGAVLAEYRRGPGPRGRKYVFLEKNGSSYFNDDAVELEHGGWLLRLARTVAALRDGTGRGVTAEFVLSAGRLWLVQAQEASSPEVPGETLFRFENECRYNYHYTDFSGREAGRLLRAAGLASRLTPVLSGGGMFLRYRELEALERELREKARSPAFGRRLRALLLERLLKEARLAARRDGAGPPELLLRFKKLNFRLAVLNYLHARTLRYSLEALRAETGGRNFEAYYGRFLSSIPAALDGLLSAPPDGFGQPPALRRALAKAAARRERERRFSAAPARLKERFAALGELASLKRTVNERVSVIASVYSGRITGSPGFPSGLDVYALSRLPAGDIPAVIERGGLPGCQPARERAPRPGPRLPAEFPLRGTVASPGDITGVVRIARKGMTGKGLDGRHILVADYLDGSFLVPMLLCGGIVAAKGGLLSHAAVIARELGKPCLVDVHGCAGALRDGDRVRLRGGLVLKLPARGRPA